MKHKKLAQFLSMVVIVTIVAGLGLASGSSVRANPGQDSPTIGSPIMGAMGVQRSTAEIMAAQQMADARGPVSQPEKPYFRWTNASKGQNPDAPAVASYGGGTVEGVSSARVPTAPQSVGIDYDTGSLLDAPAFPPDTMGAVGPTQFIIATNGRFRAYDKVTGAAQNSILDADPDVFFLPVMGGAPYNSDPRIRYDRLSQRWIIIMISVAIPNRIMFAVSDTSDITLSTVWTFFYIANPATDLDNGNPCLLDYPTLGVDANALYIGGNQFCGTSLGTAGFDQTTATVVRKSSILGAGPIVYTHFGNLMSSGTGFVGPWTPQGVDNYDPAATYGYFIGVDGASWGLLVIHRITNPGGTPTISGNLNLTVPTTGYPLSEAFSVPHLGNTTGTSGKLDALDDRLYAAHVRNGKLWTAHNINVTSSGVASTGAFNRAASRWYEITSLDATPSLVQSGTVFDSAATDPLSHWIPTIMVSGQGHAAIGFSRGGNASYVGAGFTGRLSGDTLGTMGSVVTYEAGAAAYNPPSDTGASRGVRRWGDYSMVTLDPCDDMTMYSIQEYVGSLNNWHMRTAKLLAPPPPAALASVTPNSVAAGQASVNLSVTATSSGGTGYYDPGVGFACRIAAAFSGGVTVNSVTYTSPTQLTVNVSTVGATAGAKNLTVTNPDGQAATYNSALTVTGGGATPDTIGVYRGSQFLLRNSNSTGPADITAVFGSSGDLPVVGDWDGDGVDTIGVYRSSSATFFLKNANTTAAPVAYQFTFGVAGDTPIAGDWDNSGGDGIGVFRPTNGRIYVRNTLSTGFANFAMIFGVNGDVGVAGDWDGDGVDSIGVYRPSNTRFYVTNTLCNCTPIVTAQASFGVSGDVPVTGDWDANGSDGIGVFRPTNGRTYLRNTVTTGIADVNFIYGIANDKPVAGRWTNTTAPSAPVFEVGK